MAKRQREDWKNIRNMTWKEDEDFIESVEGVLDTLDVEPVTGRRSEQRSRPRRGGRRMSDFD